MNEKYNKGCHVCRNGDLELIETFFDLGRVTSDSRPWEKGGELAVCSTCGTIQKPLTDLWRREAQAVYGQYRLYHQDDGLDQVVFDQASGQGMPRSRKVINYVHACNALASVGRVLDYGCGEGAMLTAFSDFSVSNLDGAWSLYGFDPYVKNESSLRMIPCVKDIYTETIEGTFDLITLIHSLEHIEDPVAFLRSIAPLITEGGQILIQVPYVWDNPFDMLVTDHCTHFSLQSLSYVLAEAGFDIASISASVIPRELTVLASPNGHGKSGNR